jgi:hypothetical protein
VIEQKSRFGEAMNAKSRAHRAVRRAVMSGALRPAPAYYCVDCGNQASEYDHRDYTKPLDVDPVCHRCNLLRGPARRWLGAAA